MNRASSTTAAAEKLSGNQVGGRGLEEGVSAAAREKEYPFGDILIYFFLMFSVSSQSYSHSVLPEADGFPIWSDVCRVDGGALICRLCLITSAMLAPAC